MTSSEQGEEGVEEQELFDSEMALLEAKTLKSSQLVAVAAIWYVCYPLFPHIIVQWVMCFILFITWWFRRFGIFPEPRRSSASMETLCNETSSPGQNHSHNVAEQTFAVKVWSIYCAARAFTLQLTFAQKSFWLRIQMQVPRLGSLVVLSTAMRVGGVKPGTLLVSKRERKNR